MEPTFDNTNSLKVLSDFKLMGFTQTRNHTHWLLLDASLIKNFLHGMHSTVYLVALDAV